MKEKKQTTLFFNELVSVYFQFFEEKFGLRPSFDGSAPRDLKNIIDAMKKRSEEKNVEWTFEIATAMFKTFLRFCFLDPWLKDNFMLQNLNRQKDKIFIKIKSQIDGTTKDGFTREGVAAEFNRRYNTGGSN
jgi:hypothetical protein